MPPQSPQWPPIPLALLERLEAHFSLPNIVPGFDRDTLMLAAGRIEAVKFLRFCYENQQAPNAVSEAPYLRPPNP